MCKFWCSIQITDKAQEYCSRRSLANPSARAVSGLLEKRTGILEFSMEGILLQEFYSATDGPLDTRRGDLIELVATPSVDGRELAAPTPPPRLAAEPMGQPEPIVTRRLHSNAHGVGWPPIPHRLKPRAGVGKPQGSVYRSTTPVQPLDIMPVLRHVDSAHPHCLIPRPPCSTLRLAILWCPPEFGCGPLLQPYLRGHSLLKPQTRPGHFITGFLMQSDADFSKR